MDFFEVFMRGVVWVCIQAGMLVGVGVQKLTLGLFSAAGVRHRKPPKAEQTKQEEARRIAACREAVMFYANHMGFIARECISREELEEKITNGIQPEDLAREINRRIRETPGLILGSHRFQEFPIKQTDSWRERHTYIIGRSGSGKTNLLRNMLMNDFELGNGVGVLAPEQEFLTEEILPFIPEDRINEVVYFNPTDGEHPIPINPLHLDEGEDIDLRVDDNITIFKRLMGETHARMDEILRQSLYALLERKGSTLLDIERLLSREDSTLRNEVIRTSQDELTIRFFRDTYPHYPKDAHLPITTRISRLVRPRVVRTLLCQPRQSFNFRDAMDEGKILLFNLSDGILGEQTSQLLGQLVVSKIQMAVMSRADTPAKARRQFYLYLDEFQTFTGVNEASYEKLLSRARKYKLGLILAHQQTGQLSADLLQEILGNVSTLITFNISHTDAVKFSRELVLEMGGESEHIPPEMFVNLKVGEAWGKIGKSVFPLHTRLADQHPDFIRAKEIIERSKVNYGIKPIIREKQTPPPVKKTDVDDDIDPSKVFE